MRSVGGAATSQWVFGFIAVIVNYFEKENVLQTLIHTVLAVAVATGVQPHR